MRYKFEVPEEKRVRVIMSSDAKIEADDQFAIVHALLTPRFIVKGIVACHFRNSISVRTGLTGLDTVQQSYEEISHILKLMDVTDEIPVAMGSEHALIDSESPVHSLGAQLIINEALKQDEKKLFVLGLGALTDIASAIMIEPKIQDKIILVWVGGGKYPEGSKEANLGQDLAAFNVIMNSDLEIWQLPVNVYGMLRVSIGELYCKVKPYGPIGEYLYQQLIDFNNSRSSLPGWPKGEVWCLGDSASIGVVLDEHEHHFTLVEAKMVDREMNYIKTSDNMSRTKMIRVYDYVDARFILEDFYAKLAMND